MTPTRTPAYKHPSSVWPYITSNNNISYNCDININIYIYMFMDVYVLFMYIQDI